MPLMLCSKEYAVDRDALFCRFYDYEIPPWETEQYAEIKAEIKTFIHVTQFLAISFVIFIRVTLMLSALMSVITP